MTTSQKPFSFIFHIINNGIYITDLVISGTACKFSTFTNETFEIKFSIDEIILGRNDLGNMSSLVDIQQINKACFNYVEGLFKETIPVASVSGFGEIVNLPVLSNAN